MKRSASSVTPNVLAVLTESTFLVEIEWLDQRMVQYGGMMVSRYITKLEEIRYGILDDLWKYWAIKPLIYIYSRARMTYVFVSAVTVWSVGVQL